MIAATLGDFKHLVGAYPCVFCLVPLLWLLEHVETHDNITHLNFLFAKALSLTWRYCCFCFVWAMSMLAITAGNILSFSLVS